MLIYNCRQFIIIVSSISLKYDRWLVATHFYPIGARQMFPCWDDPSFNATFSISIKHNPEYIVLSNMPVQNTTIQNGTMWTHFDKTPLMPIYLVAIMISHFPHISKERINIRYRQQLEIQHINKLIFQKIFVQQVTFHVETKWQHCRKLRKIDHVAIPGLRHDSVQNLGLVFYR